jgi:hypothetical protein
MIDAIVRRRISAHKSYHIVNCVRAACAPVAWEYTHAPVASVADAVSQRVNSISGVLFSNVTAQLHHTQLRCVFPTRITDDPTS